MFFKPDIVARRHRAFALVRSLAIVVAVSPQIAWAQDWIDPCNGYQAYVAAGGGDSAPALALERVCELVGARVISQPCLVYYTKKTASYPTYTDADLAADAAACSASMPGELGGELAGELACGEGGECAPAATVQPPAGEECGAPGVECVTPDVQEQEDCGPDGLECAPPPAPVPVSPLGGANMAPDMATPAAPAPTADDAALDLAFWNSVKDSANPQLYQAYLDRFPNGVFAPIARVFLNQADSQGTPAPVADPDGRQAFAAAEHIMDVAYSGDVDQWDGAAMRALPLYQAAAAKGLAEAWLALGDLHETGLGGAVDNMAALAEFRRAAALGLDQGDERALYLLDQLGDEAGFVAQFLAYYRRAPEAALALLDGVSQASNTALQARLRDAGYYNGALDGAFGPASRRALAAFSSGDAPPAPAPAPAPPAPQASLTADIQRQLARLGCYHGAIDGQWGPATVQAMDNYNYWTGDDGATDGPSEFALKLVTAALGPICGVD